MPPVRTLDGRASKACEACRARKTRCYDSGTSSACLRCLTHGLACSKNDSPSLPALNNAQEHNCVGVEQRIVQLEDTVQRLSAIVERGQQLGERPVLDPQIQQEDPVSKANHGQQPAPLVIIQHAASDVVPPSEAPDGGDSRQLSVVAKGLLTKSEAEQLLSIFRIHYGRWVGLDESKREAADSELMTSSPLLLCASCLIAVRHSGHQSATAIANTLFLEAKALLSESMLHVVHSIDFFQAALLLSLWSTTLGQKLLSLDSWLVTGTALQQALVSDVFKYWPAGDLNDLQNGLPSRSLAVWNHLCLSHLHACVSMRRKSVVSRADLEQARQILRSDSATNFEMRMVAELYLYLTIYEQVVAVEVNLARAKAALHSWKEEWAFLFNQPRRQFLQTSFFFAGLLIYENSLSNKSATARESMVTDMVRLASDILNLSMETADERTKHLTDHVYHIVAFAAVTLCRLLCRYESQLSSRGLSTDTDALVSRTIRWLHAIDAAPHVSQVMARLISDVQTKLRPEAQTDVTDLPPNLESSQQRSITVMDATIPDFLGMDHYFDFDWDAAIPDWQSLGSVELSNDILSPL